MKWKRTHTAKFYLPRNAMPISILKMARIIIMVALALPFSFANSFGQVAHGDTQGRDSVADTVSLNEVLIVQKLAKHSVQKDVYTISSRIRERSYGALDVLRNLPGVNVDNLTQQVSVRMDDRVVLLVDGIERPKEYIQSLTTGQIAKVEVLNVLPKKYSIAGMRYGVNIITHNVAGHYVNLQNLLMYSPGNNGDDDIANIQPHANYMYVGKKVKFNVGYGYADIHWNYPVRYERYIAGAENVVSGEVSPESPNDFYTQRTNNMSLGLDYTCGKNGVLYARSSFSHVNEGQFDQLSFYDTDLVSSPLVESEYFGNASKYNDFQQTLGYQGKLGERCALAADLSYNYRRNAIHEVYQGQEDNSTSQYVDKKNFFQGDVSGDYALGEGLSLSGGYSFMWNEYQTDEEDGALSRNIFRRHDVFSYVDASLGDKISLHAGLDLEFFTNRSLAQEANYTEVLPTVQVAYAPLDWLRIVGNYDTRMIYPNQYQLSEINYRIGNNIWSKGSSTLNPTKVSVYALQASLWDNLMLGIGYECHKDNMSYLYSQEASGISNTMSNDRLSKWSFLAMYDWRISRSLSFDNSVNVELSDLRSGSYSNHCANVRVDSRLDWFVRKMDFMASLEYTKNLTRDPLAQGYSQTGQDLWQLTLRKGFFNRRLNVSLGYCPPIRWLVHDKQKTSVSTPFYKETQSLDLRTYDNLLMLRLVFNLHHGAKGKIRDINRKFIDESKKGRGLL